jgi:hypothetical protein
MTTRAELIAAFDGAISTIEISGASASDVMTALALKQQLWETYRDLSFRFEQAAIAWILSNGEITDGEKRYYVGTETTRKCRDVGLTFRAMLDVTGGDLDPILATLSSGAFKPAAACALLGSIVPKHFDTIVSKDLKTGAPKKRLKNTEVVDD